MMINPCASMVLSTMSRSIPMADCALLLQCKLINIEETNAHLVHPPTPSMIDKPRNNIFVLLAFLNVQCTIDICGGYSSLSNFELKKSLLVT